METRWDDEDEKEEVKEEEEDNEKEEEDNDEEMMDWEEDKESSFWGSFVPRDDEEVKGDEVGESSQSQEKRVWWYDNKEKDLKYIEAKERYRMYKEEEDF